MGQTNGKLLCAQCWQLGRGGAALAPGTTMARLNPSLLLGSRFQKGQSGAAVREKCVQPWAVLRGGQEVLLVLQQIPGSPRGGHREQGKKGISYSFLCIAPLEAAGFSPSNVSFGSLFFLSHNNAAVSLVTWKSEVIFSERSSVLFLVFPV